MPGIKDNFGSGGEGLTPNGSSSVPALVDHLKALNGDAPGAFNWEIGIAVSTNTVTLEKAGRVIAVEATAASSAGPKLISFSAAAAGQVQITYDANNVPTLNFAGADAVTECAVQQIRGGKDLHDDV